MVDRLEALQPTDLKTNKMKKQTNKLSLSKKTISNLHPAEMSSVLGATNYSYAAACCGGGAVNHTKKCTQNQNTCPGHKNC